MHSSYANCATVTWRIHGYYRSANREFTETSEPYPHHAGAGDCQLVPLRGQYVFIYIGLQQLSAYVFGVALLLLIASLGVSFREIQISTRSLEIYLGTMEKGKNKNKKSRPEQIRTAFSSYSINIFSDYYQRCPSCESTKKIPVSPAFLILSTIPCAVASSSTCSRTNPHRKSWVALSFQQQLRQPACLSMQRHGIRVGKRAQTLPAECPNR